jgi:hypothetical protein
LNQLMFLIKVSEDNSCSFITYWWYVFQKTFLVLALKWKNPYWVWSICVSVFNIKCKKKISNQDALELPLNWSMSPADSSAVFLHPSFSASTWHRPFSISGLLFLHPLLTMLKNKRAVRVLESRASDC